jgi:predicted RecA/RadA family phage recombinase
MAECVYYKDGEVIDYTPLAALVAGQVIQLPDGRAGYAESAIAAGVKGALRVRGIVILDKTTTMVMLPGSEIFWDHSANKAHLLHVNDKDFYAGVCIEDAASADTTVKVALNVKPTYTVGWGSGWSGISVNTAGFPRSSGAGSDGWNGQLDATNEAQKVDALSDRGMAVAEIGIVHTLINVINGGNNAVLDISVGLANATHASDADSIAESLFIHLDGNSTTINAESDDGTTEVAATDTTSVYVAGTPFLAQWDLRDLTDIQLYINGVNKLPNSVFKLNLATGPLKMLAHMEKSANATPGNITVRGGVTQFEAVNS